MDTPVQNPDVSIEDVSEPDAPTDADMPEEDGEADGEDVISEDIGEEELGPCGGNTPNACGGCFPLEAPPGEACGTCGSGSQQCRDGAVFCSGDRGEQALNVCGGCELIDGFEGLMCGTCRRGTLMCQDGVFVCEGDPGEEVLNACGGCQELGEDLPGDRCGTCGSGEMRCFGGNQIMCVGDLGDEAFNACGGCETLPSEPGQPCGTCGVSSFICDGPGTVVCDGDSQPPCPESGVCDAPEDCQEGLICDYGHCVPEGFVYVSPGSFTMGCPPDETGCRPNQNQHEVRLTRGFLIQKTEVTYAQWNEVFHNFGPHPDPPCDENCPVSDINWFFALQYANNLSEDEGLEPCYDLYNCVFSIGFNCASVEFYGPSCEGYRLPTEAEWEYAARAGTQTATYAGTFERCEEELLDIAWVCGSSQDPPKYAVGQLRPNNWGLFDMIGNVHEWTWDQYEWPLEDDVDPIGPPELDPMFLSVAPRTIRGGSTTSSYTGARASVRGGPPAETKRPNIGFRVVRTISRD